MRRPLDKLELATYLKDVPATLAGHEVRVLALNGSPYREVREHRLKGATYGVTLVEGVLSQLQQAIEERRHHIEQLKAQRKAIAKHIEIKDLPDKDRFQRLRSEKKHFIDTIKLIAYRAETALAQLAREKIKQLDDARSLIRQLFRTEVDLIPDQQNKALTVRLHPMTTRAPAPAKSVRRNEQRGRRVIRQFRRVILNIVQMCQRPNIEWLKLVRLTNERLLLLSVSVAHRNQSEN